LAAWNRRRLLDRRLDPVLTVEVGEDGHDDSAVLDAGLGDDVGLDPHLAEGDLAQLAHILDVEDQAERPGASRHRGRAAPPASHPRRSA
jgi:hypothetical protein